jgi:AbiU2
MPQINATAEAIERVVELTCCYETWRQLTNRENELIYKPVIEQYDEFFSTVIHSLLQSVSVISYQLFERRDDTVSIISLLKTLTGSHASLVSCIKADIDLHKPLLVKVFALRNKVYAHRSNAASPKEVFQSVVITPNELGSIVSLAQKCVVALADAVGERPKDELLDEIRARSSWADQDIVNLMSALHADGR